jgi:hypothetical protein
MLDFVQPQVAGYRSCRWWLDAKNMWNSNGVAPLKSKGVQGGQASAPPFPFPGVPTRGRSYLTNRYPSALCSICFSPSIWNGFVSIGRPR